MVVDGGDGTDGVGVLGVGVDEARTPNVDIAKSATVNTTAVINFLILKSSLSHIMATNPTHGALICRLLFRKGRLFQNVAKYFLNLLFITFM